MVLVVKNGFGGFVVKCVAKTKGFMCGGSKAHSHGSKTPENTVFIYSKP